MEGVSPMNRTDDPIADYLHWDAEQSRKLDALPVCANCAEPITADYYYEIDGVIICPDCMDSDYRRSTDDYIE